ncbi:unnamed protein product [Fraxinus pennsylvanica]|uniref:Uncharacterized protein n=1 Tax=Fraxinus pennsylvanica TaxID=56036 RepID=A0AAD1ZGB5_9LAMI|nr:unnamed protein product [Fraxinus pennsylvanica]
MASPATAVSHDGHPATTCAPSIPFRVLNTLHICGCPPLASASIVACLCIWGTSVLSETIGFFCPSSHKAGVEPALFSACSSDMSLVVASFPPLSTSTRTSSFLDEDTNLLEDFFDTFSFLTLFSSFDPLEQMQPIPIKSFSLSCLLI